MNMIINNQPIRKIQIKNFGALGKIELTLDRSLQVIIGPQASGKSTLAKIIYFCRRIRDYLADFAQEIWDGHITEAPLPSFDKYLKNPFMGCFGTTKHMDPFEIIYTYDLESNKTVTITLDDEHFVRFWFSDSIVSGLVNLFKDAMRVSQEKSISFSADFSAQRSFIGLFRQRAAELFADDEMLLYIPAGRNMLATIPDMIIPESSSVVTLMQNVDISQIDLITQGFIRHIQQMRNRFGSRLEEIKQNYQKTTSKRIKNVEVDQACGLIREILKADYVYDKDGEKLYYADGKWTKLMFGSSGQQEVLWALNCIFLAILQNEKTFLVFEEPESHIFPDSQEKIAQLVALLINSTGSEVFITTHSPYMLTSINLLLYSGKVEEKKKKGTVVDYHYRLIPKEIGAYMIPGSRMNMISLIQGEEPLIDAAQIDQISDRINQKMDQLVYEEVRQESEGKAK